MNNTWLVKIKRYDGSESVLSSHSNYFEAKIDASRLNEDTQSDQHYVEIYEAHKANYRV